MKVMITLAFVVSGLILVAGLWIPAKALLAQEMLELAWAESQARQTDTRPWPWADTWPVARLALPETGQSWIVLNGVHGESLAFGPGWANAAQDGEGAVMIAGHRDTHFRALETVETGTRIRLQHRDGEWREYRVVDIRVVDSRQEGIDLSRTASDRLLLVTCYPFDSLNSNGPLRYVVEARRWRGGEHAVTDT